MRILFCSRDMSYPNTPYWARITLNLARALGRMGHEVWAPTPLYKYPLERWEEDVHFFGNSKNVKGNFDVVQGTGLRSGQKVINLAYMLSAKPFQWFFNDVSLSLRDFFYMITHEWLMVKKSKERFMLCLEGVVPCSLKRMYISERCSVSNVIVPTKFVADQLNRCGVDYEKIFVIPLGVDSQLFSPIYDDKRALMKAKMGLMSKTVLYFGGFTQFRGIKIITEAFRVVEERIKDTQLVLAIWGNPISFKDRLNFGYREDLPNLIGLADIVCLPYRCTYGMTSIPLTLLEAMSSGCPVISTNIRPMPEIIDSYKDGFLVNYNRLHIAEAMIKLLEDESLRENLGKNGRDKVLEKYDWKRIAECFTSLYNNVQS